MGHTALDAARVLTSQRNGAYKDSSLFQELTCISLFSRPCMKDIRRATALLATRCWLGQAFTQLMHVEHGVAKATGRHAMRRQCPKRR